jgi:hypothetical protein
LSSTTTCLYVGFIPLFLNIFYISLYLGQSMILCRNVTTNVTRIPHKLLYFNLLSSSPRDYENRVLFSFDSTCFNIMICPMIICIVHSCFFGII